MDSTISKLIPLVALLVLGIIEAIGGLYLEDNRSKDDFKIELISLVTLPTLIQPAIFFLVLVTCLLFPVRVSLLRECSSFCYHICLNRLK